MVGGIERVFTVVTSCKKILRSQMRAQIGQLRQAAAAEVFATSIPIIQGGEGQLNVSGHSILIHVSDVLILHPIWRFKKLLGITKDQSRKTYRNSIETS